MKPPLGRDWLAANLPHQGAMSLLESIVRWDANSLHATATRHQAPDHPLRLAGILPATAAIEYGAQAAAAHGALASQGASPAGFLASMRGVVFHVSRLDDVEGPLDIFTEQLGSGDAGVLYRFEVRGAGRCLVEGRVSVAFPR